jgi:hypothetical protein
MKFRLVEIYLQFAKLFSPIFTGPIDLGHSKNLFNSFLTPKLKKILQLNGLQNNPIGRIETSELNETLYYAIVYQGYSFITKIRKAFVVDGGQGEFLESRPDFYLGRFVSAFANLVYPTDVGYFSNSSVNDYKDPFFNAISKSLKQKVTILSFLRGTSNCLSRLGKNLLPDNYETLLDIIKHSHVKNAFNLKTLKKVEPRYLENYPKFLSFCDIGAQNTANAPDNCSLFEPTITGRGLCYTFNGLPMKDIYKQTPITKMWNEVFQPKEDVQLKYSTGYGQANGFNIVLNMFKTMSMESSSKNFFLSVSNHREWVNIFAVNFVIEPGHSYTFKVIADQIITTN